MARSGPITQVKWPQKRYVKTYRSGQGSLELKQASVPVLTDWRLKVRKSASSAVIGRGKHLAAAVSLSCRRPLNGLAETTAHPEEHIPQSGGQKLRCHGGIKRKFMSFLFECHHKIFEIGECVFKRDPNLKSLEEAVQKLDKVSADVTTFLHLLVNVKQE
ncbi:hypothetical protein IEQ34_015839 [Dendrobium chrysotoxum]|uniref:Uncharacterized protein n=1 Tax=Dendrobium chrysotoxum TaxID=161865 RepID=A0AAV7GK12_DENCH|nr:hypothetical protein IEQ34_015839 [Dendrobium chrysotoxum]